LGRLSVCACPKTEILSNKQRTVDVLTHSQHDNRINKVRVIKAIEY